MILYVKEVKGDTGIRTFIKMWLLIDANLCFSYNTIKTDMQKGNSQTQLSPGSHMLAASEAGILTLAMTNPIWVVKTR